MPRVFCQHTFGTPGGTWLEVSRQFFLMAEKQAPPPSSPGSVKGKVSKPGLTDIIDDNVMPIDPEKFTPEQKQEFEAMMQQARDQYLLVHANKQNDLQRILDKEERRNFHKSCFRKISP
uniref:Uncharacterized protein n=1 Tax=Oryza sativa subsp. japonica TaxID=39947 RepID=Q33AH7_ORYSJ|nr:hypothetical protein LOC_Os10g10090 [Oryza sativa Japonica Group]